MTRSRQYHESIIVWRNLPPYDRFCYFVLSFSSKRAWQSGSKHCQRWYEGRLCQTMADSWCCLDCIVPERMSQVSRRSEVGHHKRRTVLRCARRSNEYFVHFWTLCIPLNLFIPLNIEKSLQTIPREGVLCIVVIFKSWLQLLSASIFELLNKSPSFGLRHSANEKLLNVYVPHLSINSGSRNLYYK